MRVRPDAPALPARIGYQADPERTKMGQDRNTKEGICDIVSSFASRPDASVDQIVDLYARLNTTEGSPLTGPHPTPGDHHDTPDQVSCLVCGRGFKMLKRHIKTAHGLSEMAYRLRFGLSEDHPLVAPEYSRQKADQARASGLGRRDAAAPDETRHPA